LPSSDSGFGWAVVGSAHIARRCAPAPTESLAVVGLMDAMGLRIGVRDPFEAPA